MKVQAVKSSGSLPVEEVVRNNAKDRRDKLVRIGLAYDLAHAKGLISETDEEKKARKKAEAKKKAKEKKEMKDKLMKEKKKASIMRIRRLGKPGLRLLSARLRLRPKRRKIRLKKRRMRLRRRKM